MTSAGAPTLEMVAAEAGVSRATVSRVVNGSPSVSPAIAAAVQRAISELNYTPNRAARTLVSRQTQAIALLVPEEIDWFFSDPYLALVVKGIADRLEETDYVLNLLVSSSDPGRKTRRYLTGGNVDGALVVSHHAGNRDLVELSQLVPTVFGGEPSIPGVEEPWFVDVDNVAGGQRATEHLLTTGRQHVGTITGPLDMHASVDRLAGWRRAQVAAGRPDSAVAHGDFSLLSGARAMRELLAAHPDLDGVFVASDLMARGALGALAGAGRRVPDDVAVVGYDDNVAAVSEPPLLTTVRQPSTETGAEMADLLLRVLAGDPPAERGRILDTSLVRRETT